MRDLTFAFPTPAFDPATLSSLLSWGPSREVNTQKGPRSLRKASPTPAFWSLWRNQKPALQSLGVSCGKDAQTGAWEACWWSAVTPKTAASTPTRAVPSLETSGLLQYQVDPAKFLFSAVNQYGAAVDTSDTGTGKTYVAGAIARHFATNSDKAVVVVCPKAVRPSWLRAAKHLGIPEGKLVAVGYEEAKTAKTGLGAWVIERLNPAGTVTFTLVPCPTTAEPLLMPILTFSNRADFTKFSKVSPLLVSGTPIRIKSSDETAKTISLQLGSIDALPAGRVEYSFTTEIFHWDTSKIGLLIFDEVHRCKGRSTDNAQLLMAARDQAIPCLTLSATAASNPLDMRALGYTLGLHDGGNGRSKDFYNFCRRHECEEGTFGGWVFASKRAKKNGKWIAVPDEDRQNAAMSDIHNALRGKMSRIRVSDLGDQFPECLTIAEPIDFGADIQAVYAKMESELAELEAQSEDDQEDCVLTILLRARQKIELLRVPTIVEMTQDEIENGRSVVIFASFTATIEALAQKLNTTCVVIGGQADAEREANIQAFQADESRIIICNMAAGGVGISLHDLHGTYPRTSLICPTWRIDELRQAIGRIWRAGAKSKAIQRFLFAAGTVEERMSEAVISKGGNLNALNGDTLTAGLEFLHNALSKNTLTSH